MAKKIGGKQSIIGAVGGVLIGAAILLFVCTMILSSLKASSSPGSQERGTPALNATADANAAEWNATNATINQLSTFLTVCCILLGVLGIVIIGASIIGSISGGFGG
jgi:hypothetical protein